MRRNDITPDVLKHLYIDKFLSKNEIAIKLGCTMTTIHKRMLNFNIPSRKQKQAARIAMAKRIIKINKNHLKELYLNRKLSISEISRKLKYDTNTIKRELIRNNIILRTKAESIRIALSRKKVSKEVIELLYNKFHLTQKQIAKKLGKSRGYILQLMKAYQLSTRNASQTQLIYPKFNFSKNLLEKAYLVGFRIGDLNVNLSPSGNLILVNCTSTKNNQIQLFKNLFKKYGFVWIGKPRSDKNRVCVVRLNHTFDFLLPKKDEIPKWILKNDDYFLSFIGGYTDAEGCMGVFNGLARFTIASYDKNLLKQAYKRLTYMGISCNPPRILVKKGHVKSNGLVYRQDHWHLTIVKKSTLLLLFQSLEPYLKHKKRIKDLKKARANIIRRNQKLFGIQKFS